MKVFFAQGYFCDLLEKRRQSSCNSVAAQMCLKLVKCGCTAAVVPHNLPLTDSEWPWRPGRCRPDTWPTPPDAPWGGRIAACSSFLPRRRSSQKAAPVGRAAFGASFKWWDSTINCLSGAFTNSSVKCYRFYLNTAWGSVSFAHKWPVKLSFRRDTFYFYYLIACQGLCFLTSKECVYFCHICIYYTGFL